MGKKNDLKKGDEISDGDLQDLIDNGDIFSSEDTDFSTNYEAYEIARQLAGQIRDCDCGRSEPHVHIAMKRPEDSSLSAAEFQEIARRHFDEVLKKKLREKRRARNNKNSSE